MPDNRVGDGYELEARYIAEAKELLALHGFVVVKAKSYRQAEQRQAIAQFAAQYADEQRRSTELWAQTTLHNEIRELMARCTFLYGAAMAHGATADELGSGRWPTSGVNCPNGRDCDPIQKPV